MSDAVRVRILVKVIVAVLLLSFLSASAEVKTIHTAGPGLWDGDPSRQFRLIKDLSIGVGSGDERYILGRVFDLTVDSESNIYVLDNGFVRVQKYDASGKFLVSIGGKGEGPGEFFFPTAIAVDELNRIYVAGRGRVSIFNGDGSFVDEFKHGFNDDWPRSMRVGECCGIYISCLNVLEQKILHKFNFNHEQIASFCMSYAFGQDIDVRIERMYAGGAIDITKDGVIYYTQMTPYEIRTFSPAGELLSSIHRDNDFMAPPAVVETENGYTLPTPTASYSIVILKDGKFINIVKPPLDPENPRTIIDLFDAEGNLLTSETMQANINIMCTDNKGYLYAIDYDDFPSVTRYRAVIWN